MENEPGTLRLTYSCRLERLADSLAAAVGMEQRKAPLARIQVVVPHRDVETWLRQRIACRLGVSANVEFMSFGRFLRRLAEAAEVADASNGLSTGEQAGAPCAAPRRLQVVDEALLTEHLLGLFFAPDAAGSFKDIPEVRAYLSGGLQGGGGQDAGAASNSRRLQLAMRLARLFRTYDESTDFLRQWQKGEDVGFRDGPAIATEKWQKALWRQVRSDLRFHESLCVPLCELPDQKGFGLHLPLATFFFGIDDLPLSGLRLVQALMKLSGQEGEATLALFAFNPCQDQWDDIKDVKSLNDAVAGRLGAQPDADSLLSDGDDNLYGLEGVPGNPLLMAMGRPGRERIRVLNELSQFCFDMASQDGDGEDCSAEANSRGDGEGKEAEQVPLLLQVQRDVAGNVTDLPRISCPDGDRSFRMVSCIGIQRECEEVAARVARLFKADKSLKYGDVSVLVADGDADAYFARLVPALADLGIPACLRELPAARSGRILEAALRLVHLPLAGFSRTSVMEVLTLPAVMANVPGAPREALVPLVDSLGVFQGVDRMGAEGLGEGYLNTDAEVASRSKRVPVDLYNWDQGLARLALGVAMRSSGDGEAGPFERPRPTREDWNRLIHPREEGGLGSEGMAAAGMKGLPPEGGTWLDEGREEEGGGQGRLPEAVAPVRPVRRHGGQLADGGDVDRYWPVAAPMEMGEDAPRWLLLAQSLLADARFAAMGNLPEDVGADGVCQQGAGARHWRTMGEWSSFISSMLDAYLSPGDEAEERQKSRLLQMARDLRHVSIRSYGGPFREGAAVGDGAADVPVPYAVPCRLLEGQFAMLSSTSGNYLLDGVNVARFTRMVPGRHVFVAGLSAGAFPQPQRRDRLDLAEARLDGDWKSRRRNEGLSRFRISERERGRYLFLQAVMGARESLTLSWQGRDLRNGTSLDPASPVVDFQRLLQLYGVDSGRFLRILPPRRCDLASFRALADILEGKAVAKSALEAGARSGSPAASREAAALTLREILKGAYPDLMDMASADGALTTGDGVGRLLRSLGGKAGNEVASQVARLLEDLGLAVGEGAADSPASASLESLESSIPASLEPSIPAGGDAPRGGAVSAPPVAPGEAHPAASPSPEDVHGIRRTAMAHEGDGEAESRSHGDGSEVRQNVVPRKSRALPARPAGKSGRMAAMEASLEGAEDGQSNGQSPLPEASDGVLARATPSGDSNGAGAQGRESDQDPLTTMQSMPAAKETRVSVSKLARFLENPAQASAAAFLRLRQDNGDETDDAILHVDDETFTFDDKLEQSVFLNGIVSEFLCGSAEFYQGKEYSRLLELKGERKAVGTNKRTKNGELTRLTKNKNERELAEIRDKIDELNREIKGLEDEIDCLDKEIGEQNAKLKKIERAFFGRSMANQLGMKQADGIFPASDYSTPLEDRFGKILDAWVMAIGEILGDVPRLEFRKIGFDFDMLEKALVVRGRNGRLGRSADGQREFKLGGTTGVIGVDGKNAHEINSFQFKPSKVESYDKYVARAFVHGLAYLASEGEDGVGHELKCHVVGYEKDKKSQKTVGFTGIRPDDARKYLLNLAVEMHSSPNAYWMPGEGVLKGLALVQEKKEKAGQAKKEKAVPTMIRCLDGVKRSAAYGALRPAEVEALRLPTSAEMKRAFGEDALCPSPDPCCRWGYFYSHGEGKPDEAKLKALRLTQGGDVDRDEGERGEAK